MMARALPRTAEVGQQVYEGQEKEQNEDTRTAKREKWTGPKDEKRKRGVKDDHHGGVRESGNIKGKEEELEVYPRRPVPNRGPQ